MAVGKLIYNAQNHKKDSKRRNSTKHIMQLLKSLALNSIRKWSSIGLEQ